MRQSAAPISMTATRRRFVQAALHFSPQTLHSCPRGQTPRPRGRQTPCTLIAETSGEADHPGPPDARRRPSFAHAPEPVRGPGGPDASPHHHHRRMQGLSAGGRRFPQPHRLCLLVRGHVRSADTWIARFICTITTVTCKCSPAAVVCLTVCAWAHAQPFPFTGDC